MMFCKNCGAQLDDGAKFCAQCGCSNNDSSIPVNINTKESTAEFAAADIADNKFLAIFCYFGFLAMLVPLTAKPDSAFIKFHANQALVLQLLSIALVIVCIIPVLGWIVAAIGSIFTFVCMIMGIVYCCQGRAVELPLIGSIKIIRGYK